MSAYLRLFSIISLLAVIAIAGLSGVMLRGAAVAHVMATVERGSADLSQGYINAVWKQYRNTIIPLEHDPAQLRTNPQVMRFAENTVNYFQGTQLIRVNIYSGAGTLLMTDSIHTNLAGNAASPDDAFALSHIKSVGAASQVLHDVALRNGGAATIVQTVMPIRIGQDSEGILELLADVSAPWDDIVHFQLYCTGGIVIIFLMFLGVLFLTSRKAESIIARQHEANVELAAAAATAQAESRDKSQFLANVSHELRTPLNAIIGFSDIIKNEAMPHTQDRKYDAYINDIHASGVHLLSLINDILDYSKAEAGKLELEVSEVNAHKMVQNCLRLVAPRAESGGVALEERLPKDPFSLHTDGKKFKQVLLNLLSNAVKFTPSGGKVSVSGWHNVTDDLFYFEVQDSGIGIAPKDISRAMALFGQVDNTLKRKYEGTGLGLPLTKKFVELLGGKFTIESELNVGTKITFSLPRRIAPREGL
ncbi:MAG: HAMP domain-containing histidine kinase, partial [Pseudomonadota bacterium]|nr:HAMP domain-containing histidine kinase [Pseudomonadota bacterium]